MLGEEMIAFVAIRNLIVFVLVVFFVVYFLIAVVRFMKRKNQSDVLLIKKIDELSQRLDELKEDKKN